MVAYKGENVAKVVLFLPANSECQAPERVAGLSAHARYIGDLP